MNRFMGAVYVCAFMLLLCGCAKPEKVAAKHWGANFRSLQPLDTPSVKSVFGGKSVFRVIVFYPPSKIAGPETLTRAMIIGPGRPVFIEKDEEAVAAISEQRPKAKNAEEAILVGYAFAALRGYSVRAAGHPDRPEDKNKDFSQSVNATVDGWIVSLVLERDAAIQWCDRYKLHLSRDGALSIAACERICMHSGYE